MQVNLNIPEKVARSFGEDSHGVEKAALEALAIEGVRSGKLSRGQARRLLGFQTRYDLDGFLKAHGLPVEDSLEQVQQDSELVLSLGHR
jgi:hypothetical protein